MEPEDILIQAQTVQQPQSAESSLGDAIADVADVGLDAVELVTDSGLVETAGDVAAGAAEMIGDVLGSLFD